MEISSATLSLEYQIWYMVAYIVCMQKVSNSSKLPVEDFQLAKKPVDMYQLV